MIIFVLMILIPEICFSFFRLGVTPSAGVTRGGPPPPLDATASNLILCPLFDLRLGGRRPPLPPPRYCLQCLL